MKRINVVSYKSLPAEPPFKFTILAWLVLDKVGASAVVCAVAYTVIAFWWLVWLIRKIAEKHVDLFEDSNTE